MRNACRCRARCARVTVALFATPARAFNNLHLRLVETRLTAPLSATYPSCAQNCQVKKSHQPRRQRARRAPASPVHLPSMEGAADGGRPSLNPPAECRPIHHFYTVVMTHQRISQSPAARLITTDIFKHRRLWIRGGGMQALSRPHQPVLFAPSLHFSDRGSGRQREAPSAGGAF